MPLTVRVLLTTCPLVEGSDGVGMIPGPSHWNVGVSVTPSSRVTEHVRITDSPIIREDTDADKEITVKR